MSTDVLTVSTFSQQRSEAPPHTMPSVVTVIDIQHVTCPNCTNQDTARPWFPSNRPAPCAVDWINSSWEHTHTPTSSSLIVGWLTALYLYVLCLSLWLQVWPPASRWRSCEHCLSGSPCSTSVTVELSRRSDIPPLWWASLSSHLSTAFLLFNIEVCVSKAGTI